MNFFKTYGVATMKVAKIAFQFSCFAHCFNQYVAEITWCIGPSMLPSFSMHGLVAVEHLSQHFRPLEIGDVIVCTSPAKPGRSVLKRVIGLPGDNVCEDPTVKNRKFVNVPEGHVWVGGDNLSNSTDSRSYGPVALGLVKGRVFAKVWPGPEILKNNLVQSLIALVIYYEYILAIETDPLPHRQQSLISDDLFRAYTALDAR